jgi:hypothetical protein
MKNKFSLNAAGEALKALGEGHVMLTYREDGGSTRFSVGLKSSAGKYGVDTFGHGETPDAAFVEAAGKLAAKAEEDAIRARIQQEVEERVRAEMQPKQDLAA